MTGVWEQAAEVWNSGGWAMYPLAATSLLLFAVGGNLWLRLRGRGYRSTGEAEWRRWLARPEERKGPVGELIEFVLGADDFKDLEVRFGELHATEVAPFSRELRFMKICVAAAPLLGLLGTVTGMLSTFRALAEGSGGDKTMNLVAGGISEALITTETGLVIALPGLFLQYHLGREKDRYRAFLAHLESVCMQFFVTKREVKRRAQVDIPLAKQALEG
jgi:biopolymer transport protein ExbB